MAVKEDTPDRTRTIAAMEDHAQRIREELTAFIAAGEGWVDDESNLDRYDEIERALNDVEGLIGGLVP
jgi:hypothetical protein